MKKAHKIRLNPTTPEQVDYFWKATKVSRNAWNWALSEYNRRNREGQKVKIAGKGDTLKAEYTSIKNDFEFACEVSTYASQQAFLDLQRAINTYFDKKKKGLLTPPKGWKPRKDGNPFGWPRFKKVHRTIPSFYEANIGLNFDGFYVKLPKLGRVNMTEQLRFDGKVLGGRISYRQKYWWLSVQVELETEVITPKNGAVGVDLGVKYLATTSDEKPPYKNPKPFAKAQAKLRRFQRKLDRQRRSCNPDNYNENGTVKKRPKEWRVSGKMKKTEAQIIKLHARIANIRINASHNLTTELAREYSIVCLEDLNIRGMLKNGKLSKAISDAAFYEKRRQFEYKVAERGGTVVFVDRWFPSSKQCNGCDWIYAELSLSEREWVCQNCGAVNDREKNAALNLREEGIRILQGE